MSKSFTVYIHTTPNMKYYVGITSQRVTGRWRNGYGYINNSYFTRAINKYGWDNIEHEIIAEHLTEEEAKKFEIKLIYLLKSNDTKFGYNLTAGGDGTTFRKCSAETRAKISKSNTGKHHSAERKERQRIAITGRRHSDETKEKIRIGNIGNKNGKRVKVICITTGEIFDCAQDGAKKYNMHRAGIINVCRGKSKTGGKLNGIPLIWEYYTEKE